MAEINKPQEGWVDTGAVSVHEGRVIAFAEQLLTEGDLPVDYALGDMRSVRFLIERYELPTNDLPQLIGDAIRLHGQVSSTDSP